MNKGIISILYVLHNIGVLPHAYGDNHKGIWPESGWKHLASQKSTVKNSQAVDGI